jgi:hypothetical protein
VGAVVEQEIRERIETIRELDGVDLDKALCPQRPPETMLHTMETSLSRLPSFRIVAGWIVLIVGLFLAFVFTHQ